MATRAAFCASAFGLALAACTTNTSPTAGLVASLQLDLLAPSVGSPGAPNVDRSATFDLTALGDDGQPFPGDAIVDVYVSYGGVLTGAPSACGGEHAPIETLTIHGGTLVNHQLDLPIAYGSTAIWAAEAASHVVGASNPIYFPNPTIGDIQRPTDPSAVDAQLCSSFDKKFVTIDHAAMPGGMLLVDSVFGDAITVTDTSASDYQSLYVYSYSQPAADLVPGRHLKSLNGNISKFFGFNELNFPVLVADDDAPVEPQSLPAPITLVQTDITNLAKLNAANAATVEVSGKVCDTTTDPYAVTDWQKYDSFVLGTHTCSTFDEFEVELPSKIVGTFDPTTLVGQTITVRGMLKSYTGVSNDKPYNRWTVAVRDAKDVPQ